MRKSAVLTALLVPGLVALIGLSAAQEKAAKEEAPQRTFVGADGCKICHKSAKKGDQYGKWLAGPHAKAFETLGTDKAKEVAAAKGLKGNPQELDECLSCHVTGHGAKAELLGKKYNKEQGVWCESCHGAGDDYKSKKVMESREASLAAGMIVPTAETCTECHNEKSPGFKGFDYDEYYAKIAHENPANKAAKEAKE